LVLKIILIFLIQIFFFVRGETKTGLTSYECLF